MAKHTRPDPMLYLDDHRGVYIPRDFARDTRRECITGVDPDDLDYLAGEDAEGNPYTSPDDPDDHGGPEGDHYWDVWQTVCDRAKIHPPECPGYTFTIYQDGAVWLVPDGMEWDDRDEWYRWPDDPREIGDRPTPDPMDPEIRDAVRESWAPALLTRTLARLTHVRTWAGPPIVEPSATVNDPASDLMLEIAADLPATVPPGRAVDLGADLALARVAYRPGFVPLAMAHGIIMGEWPDPQG